MVEEAKAFCPGCGNAFVEEEKRQEASSFDTMERTVELDSTTFGQMLSDMGLNISKAPDAAEQRIEAELPPAKPREMTSDKTNPGSKTKWFILGGVLVILVFLLIVLAGVLLYMFWPSLR